MRAPAALLALAALAACSTAAPGPASPAEAACLRDVLAVTNNPDQAVMTADASTGGTRVIIGVGPDRALWQCIATPDGTTSGVMSLTDEGAL